MDLEWPYSRVDGIEKEGKVALVQLCNVDTILLIHVSKMEKFPQKVKELIESPKVPKMGAYIRNDGRKLFCDYGIISSNLIELGALAGEIDHNFASARKRPIVSLAIMVSDYLKKTLDKGSGARKSNWSKDLTPEHIAYASNDVHSGLMVYESLMRTAHSSEIQLLPKRYTVDLANELRQPDGGPVSQLGTTLADPQAGEAPHRREYALWRQGYGLLGICVKMGSRAHPQREEQVISQIIHALTEDPALPFSMTALISLVKLHSSSWHYNRDTLEKWTREGRGTDENCASG
ncbi:ribonuclease H-like domain-containing protein [Lactarius quietus]|nr:ribonuclease H-like domain-containing protein [Lactarius quietus]